jgi:alkyldihydroxyacetonephosphate synthase
MAETMLPAHAIRWLQRRTGLVGTVPQSGPKSPELAQDATEDTVEKALSETSVLSGQARDALTAVVGAEHVRTDVESRVEGAAGLSYLDLMRRRGAGRFAVPDAVVAPADADEVSGVIRACAEWRIALVPLGGGTSVVGGVAALRGGFHSVVVLDLRRLDKLVSVDVVSRLAVLQAGMPLPDAERALAAHGFTLGHVPQSYERATVGGCAATRSAGQASSGYGRFEDMVEGLRVATPRGQWRLGVAPASAAGPDLKHLVVGSEGAFGVITEVTVRVRRIPAVRRYEGFVLDGWERGAAAVAELAQRGVLADVTRLSDEDETEVTLALRGGWQASALRRYLRARRVHRPCLLILGWEDEDRYGVAHRRAATLRALRTHGRVVRLGRPLGEAWRHGRFSGPRQRDTLLDAGVCVETLETATHWSKLGALRGAVTAALKDALTEPGRTPVVMCHISHAYETGASLYFTVLVPRDPGDPAGQWQRAKRAACEAISTGPDGPLGTISHHHAVGVDHAPYLGHEIGDIGTDVLRAIKKTVDPTGMLNPGKLLP